MILNILRICIPAALIFLTIYTARGFSLAPLKPLCEVVALAELIVAGVQTKCIVPVIEDPSLELGPNSTVEFEVHELLYGAPITQDDITIVQTICLEENREYILLLRQPIDNYHYFRAYGNNDILSIDRKDEVLECIVKYKE